MLGDKFLTTVDQPKDDEKELHLSDKGFSKETDNWVTMKNDVKITCHPTRPIYVFVEGELLTPNQ